MKTIVSLRSEIPGRVIYHNIKANLMKKVLLEGGFIFIENQPPVDTYEYIFPGPVSKSTDKSTGVKFNVTTGEEIHENEELAKLYSTIGGEVRVSRRYITIENPKDKTTCRFMVVKRMKILVNNQDQVVPGQHIATVYSPLDGVALVMLEGPVGSKQLMSGFRIIDGLAYSIPDEFKLRVRNDEIIQKNQLIGEGNIEEGYEFSTSKDWSPLAFDDSDSSKIDDDDDDLDLDLDVEMIEEDLGDLEEFEEDI